MRWLVAGGGTGGHVTLALALGEEIAASGDALLFAGSERGLEQRLVPAAGFELATLPAGQVMGRSLPARLGALVRLALGALAALRLLGRFRPDLVLSVGGYAAVPAVAAARLRGVPVALVEPNAIPGRTNRLAGRFARRVFLAFDDAAAAFPRLRARGGVQVLGVPLRRALVSAMAGARKRRSPAPPLRVLVFGGSQGARQINEAVIEALPQLPLHQLAFFHQTGEADRERVTAAHAAAGSRAEVVAFEPDMPGRYAWADVAVCRAGALTVAELALVGLPALLVPYPYAADDHQTANARALERAGAARLLDSRRLDGARLAEALVDLVCRPAQLGDMARAAAGLGRPDAARAIVAACRTALGARSAPPRGVA